MAEIDLRVSKSVHLSKAPPLKNLPIRGFVNWSSNKIGADFLSSLTSWLIHSKSRAIESPCKARGWLSLRVLRCELYVFIPARVIPSCSSLWLGLLRDILWRINNFVLSYLGTVFPTTLRTIIFYPVSSFHLDPAFLLSRVGPRWRNSHRSKHRWNFATATPGGCFWRIDLNGVQGLLTSCVFRLSTLNEIHICIKKVKKLKQSPKTHTNKVLLNKNSSFAKVPLSVGHLTKFRDVAIWAVIEEHPIRVKSPCRVLLHILQPEFLLSEYDRRTTYSTSIKTLGSRRVWVAKTLVWLFGSSPNSLFTKSKNFLSDLE